jgi:predicted ATPase/DNA-binding winged helix-turn-helix (wHTH) protein
MRRGCVAPGASAVAATTYGRRTVTTSRKPEPTGRAVATPSEAAGAFSFGPFRLFPAARLLEKNGAPVALGARALDVLLALIEHAGEVVGKVDLFKRVWPDVVVEEANLRVHVGALRKALGDGQGGARYVTNIPGRGYSFVAPVSRLNAPSPPAPAHEAMRRSARLPKRVEQTIGRDEAVRDLVDQVMRHRLVTVVGPGGIGKTTVALAVAEQLSARLDHAVHFLDLAWVSDPKNLPSVLASEFGLIVHSNDPLPNLADYLQETPTLLVLDSCEHIVDAVAEMAERIFRDVPLVYILATSREPLRVQAERICRLAPLEIPPEGFIGSVDEAMGFSAVRLFVERAASNLAEFEPDMADIGVISDVCRKLDGIALAIELAAGRVGAYGIRGVAVLLEDRFTFLTHGRRTALPRHRTLSATLDWSYDLLSAVERTVLCRLSLLMGPFSLEAARAVAASCQIGSGLVTETIGDLVAKSLVTADLGATSTSYRLLESTRVYARQRLLESGEINGSAGRHAEYYLLILEAGSRNPREQDLTKHVGNVRSAIEWAFSSDGDHTLAVRLVAYAGRMCLEASSLGDYCRWATRAVTLLDERTVGTREEMELQASLGFALLYAKGNSEDVRMAFARSLELAEKLNEPDHQVRLLGGLHIFHLRIGDFIGALVHAQRAEAIARTLADPSSLVAANWMLGISNDQMGNPSAAQQHCEAALRDPRVSFRNALVRFNVDHRIRGLCAYSRTLWIRGLPDQAVRTAGATIEEAATLRHPISFCISLIWAGGVYLWAGDCDTAQERVDELIANARKHAFAPYVTLGFALQGKLQIARGDCEKGVRLLEDALDALQADRHQMMTAVLASHLAEGLAKLGRHPSALTVINGAIAQVERSAELANLPEMLRIKGEIINALSPGEVGAIEGCFLKALDLARVRSALGWELRIATSLAQFRKSRGKREDAGALLRRVHGRFTEGFTTADLVMAKRLLDELEGHPLVEPGGRDGRSDASRTSIH